ncbi:rod shape-determining protein RodA [Salibacteraceae bacterium]|nr:rod shape-determining protein RodA [Salibacteraceae bacterium]MDB9708359.1 rod shape-determining protein RodA [Salibacteraceae bacterium]
MRIKRNIFEDIDWVMVVIYLALVLFGWISIYAATYDEMHPSIFDLAKNHGKQALWIGLALVIGLIMMFFDTRFFETFAYPIYGFALFLLLAVLVLGTEVKGAQSWFVLGPISFQPSEIAKFGTALALAKYLSVYGSKFDSKKVKIISLAIIFLPGVFILLQPDVGSVLVFTSLLIVLYRQGLSGWIFGLGFVAVVLFILALFLKQYQWTLFEIPIQGNVAFIVSLSALAAAVYYFLRKKRGSLLIIVSSYIASLGYFLSIDYVFDNILQPHHQNRINELLGIVSDPSGAGYNVHQSKIAIGSGGFSGKGFLQGTQTKYHFVPEQSTDFIFCTVGEEWGFLGSLILIGLFLTLMGRIIWLAEKQRSVFTRVYGYCVASILFIHFTINIAMTIGLAPVIGIPLPFFSYGGSSLWSFTLLLFTFIKLDSERKYVLR